ncbi:MAG: hypothetical protein TB2022_3580 [Candidatus Phytoplasma citri]|nr:MAG: hypothetical protein TB2022_3250 [Candidatus Phytoplasma aurantifolia]WEX20439.1 MAG: hypothetical protein TB2022_3580 [Candidatus Phytoplasma aurantifolia]
MANQIKEILNQIKEFFFKIKNNPCSKNYALIIITCFFIMSNLLSFFVNFQFGMKLNSFLCLIYDGFMINFLLANTKEKNK